MFYNDLSVLDKNWFMDAPIGVAELDQNTTRAEVLEVFLALNEGGKPVAKEVLDHARELLKMKQTIAKCNYCEREMLTVNDCLYKRVVVKVSKNKEIVFT